MVDNRKEHEEEVVLESEDSEMALTGTVKDG